MKSTDSGLKSTWSINRGCPKDPRTHLDYYSITIIKQKTEKHLKIEQKTHCQGCG